MQLVSFSKAVLHDINSFNSNLSLFGGSVSFYSYFKSLNSTQFWFLSDRDWFENLQLSSYFPVTKATAITLRVTHIIFILYTIVEIIFYWIHLFQRKQMSNKSVKIDQESIHVINETMRKIIENESENFAEFIRGNFLVRSLCIF